MGRLEVEERTRTGEGEDSKKSHSRRCNATEAVV